MRRSPVALPAVLLAAVVLLAGCGSPGGDGASSSSSSTNPDVDADTYTIVLEEFPAAPMEAGANLTFRNRVLGSVQAYSDHIGAHFGRNSTTSPSTVVYNLTCAHQVGNLPGVFTVNCVAPQEPGTYFLRGHARITEAGGNVDWWSEEHPFTVVPLQDPALRAAPRLSAR